MGHFHHLPSSSSSHAWQWWTFPLHLVWIKCLLLRKVVGLRRAAWNINKIGSTQFSDIAQILHRGRKKQFTSKIFCHRSEISFEASKRRENDNYQDTSSDYSFRKIFGAQLGWANFSLRILRDSWPCHHITPLNKKFEKSQLEMETSDNLESTLNITSPMYTGSE